MEVMIPRYWSFRVIGVITTLGLIGGSTSCRKGPSGPSPAANSAPTVAGIVVSPTGVGMVGATSFTFSPNDARDANGDALTFAWRFGDGGTGSGPTVAHTYLTQGSFTVELTVSDAAISTPAPSVVVTVGPNLSGAWRHTSSTDFKCTEGGIPQSFCSSYTIQSLTLNQSAGDLSGSLTPNIFFIPTGFIAFGLTGNVGPISHPATVRFATGDQVVTALNNDILNYSFEGQTSASGTTMTGTLTQLRKHPPINNPGGGTICNSTAPVVTCPPETKTSLSTFSQ